MIGTVDSERPAYADFKDARGQLPIASIAFDAIRERVDGRVRAMLSNRLVA